MSLRHALLAVLTSEPMTGYDLVKYFDGSVAFIWNAPHSQIYPELRRMENDGLLHSEIVPRGERAKKRLYGLTEGGYHELHRWSMDVLAYPPVRDPYRLRAAFFEWGSYESARRQLREHINHYTEQLTQWRQMLEDIEAHRVPLLARRLERRPGAEHRAIVEFKRLAFRGEVAKAQAELAWANEALELIDEMENSGSPLASFVVESPPAAAGRAAQRED
jgi:PadR family transcriptional regulator, regulator of vanillate utilization